MRKSVFIGLTVGLALSALAASMGAHAAACLAGTGGACPAGNVCLSVTPPTTREPAEGETVGVALPATEIDKYSITLNSKSVYSGDSPLHNYVIPTGGQLKTTDTWAATVTDTEGRVSKPFACTQRTAVIGPKLPPAVPVGLVTDTAK